MGIPAVVAQALSKCTCMDDFIAAWWVSDQRVVEQGHNYILHIVVAAPCIVGLLFS